MSKIDVLVRSETPEDAPCLETLTKAVFGPGMLARAAYFLREGVDHEMDLSFVAEIDQRVVGTVRLTKVIWGEDVVLMLGPLAVLPDLKGRGIGKALMQRAVEAARARSRHDAVPAVILVGDVEYYGAFGFVPIASSNILLPRPADPRRILACELADGQLSKLQGPVKRFVGEEG